MGTRLTRFGRLIGGLLACCAFAQDLPKILEPENWCRQETFIHESGFQCVDEALDDTGFCESHQRVVDFETLRDSPWRRTFIRIVALILLLLFLIPFLYTLRGFYAWRPVQAQEGM